MKTIKAQELQLVKTVEKLNDRELSRAIRDAIIGEINAVKQYENISDASTNAKVSEVLQDIANEEKIHIGELQELLQGLGIDEQDYLDEGSNEVNKN